MDLRLEEPEHFVRLFSSAFSLIVSRVEEIPGGQYLAVLFFQHFLLATLPLLE